MTATLTTCAAAVDGATDSAADFAAAVSADATAECDAALRELLAPLSRGHVCLRRWMPDGARRTRRRIFVGASVGAAPVLVAKVPLDDEDRMLDHEWDVLAGTDLALAGAPQPVRRLQRGFVMTWVPDVDLPALLHDVPMDAIRGVLQRSVDLAAGLHGARGDPGVPGQGVAVAAGYLGGSMATLPDVTLAALTRARTGTFHGDLGPWNVRAGTTDGAMRLVDWEDYLPSGIQAVDALNLVLTSALAVYPTYSRRLTSPSTTSEQGFDWLIERMLPYGVGGFGAVAVEALTRYAVATGQSPRELAALIPVFCCWMVERIRRQGRSTDHLFYRPLLESFVADPAAWTGAFDA